MGDESQTASLRVLVVDDSETDRKLILGLLKAAQPDWLIEVCNDAPTALQYLADHSIAAVVTDLFMPEMSGEEFLIEVRKQFPSVPVILITSQGNDAIAARSLSLGAVNYVPKRRLAEDLVDAIEEIFRSHHESVMAGDLLSHLTYSRTVFQIDSCLEQMRSLLHLIRERLQTLRTLDAEEARLVTDAVREALMNSYKHGNGATDDGDAAQQPGGGIQLELRQDENAVYFAITDEGKGFDTDPHIDSKSGGLYRIRQQMDAVEFNAAGNCITLTKQLHGPNPA